MKKQGMPQATRANVAQIRRHIELQRAGQPASWDDLHPVASAVLGGLMLFLFIGGMLWLWILQGAGLIFPDLPA